MVASRAAAAAAATVAGAMIIVGWCSSNVEHHVQRLFTIVSAAAPTIGEPLDDEFVPVHAFHTKKAINFSCMKRDVHIGGQLVLAFVLVLDVVLVLSMLRRCAHLFLSF